MHIGKFKRDNQSYQTLNGQWLKDQKNSKVSTVHSQETFFCKLQIAYWTALQPNLKNFQVWLKPMHC